MNLSFPHARKTYRIRNSSTTYAAVAGNLQTSSTISQTVPTGISQVQPTTSKSMREVEVQTIYIFSYPTTYTIFKPGDKIIWSRDKTTHMFGENSSPSQSRNTTPSHSCNTTPSPTPRSTSNKPSNTSFEHQTPVHQCRIRIVLPPTIHLTLASPESHAN